MGMVGPYLVGDTDLVSPVYKLITKFVIKYVVTVILIALHKSNTYKSNRNNLFYLFFFYIFLFERAAFVEEFWRIKKYLQSRSLYMVF